MHLTFLVPDIHDRPTGGNLYNRRMVAELQDRHSVEVHSGLSPPTPHTPDAVVVDSLLTRHDEALPRLRQHHSGPLVLLAHYLHCIDPREQSSAAAQTERAVLPLFDAVVTTSHYAQRALRDDGVAPDRVHVVSPGLDDSYRAPLPDRPSDAPPHLLTVASWLPGKGLSTLLDQLDTLTDLDWRWTLVGDDTLDPNFADTVRARLRDTSIADRITAPGAVAPEAMRDHYDAADLFVLPSRFETCSMATREALARGLPVVGYDVGGMAENLGDRNTGHLVPPDQPEALTEALRRLLIEPETRAAMRTAARERSEDFPTWPTAAVRLQSFLQSL